MSEGVRLLYVDDDPGIARLVQRALEREGYRVEHAAGVSRALDRIKQGDIDAVGLDHFMADGTGLDVLASLRGQDAPPVVYVTSSGDTSVAVAALKAGAADYVPKDVAGDFLELLVSAIEGALEQTRLRREKEAAEAAVREQRDRAELLLREVNHRVGNSLALVAALVRMQSNAISDPGAIAALRETQNRITAIANIHRRLYTSDDVRTVEMAAYLASLVAEIETAMRTEGHENRVKLDAEPIHIATDKAVSLGVAVTELITNAYKYAYPAGASGAIRVIMRRDGDAASLTVEDDGVGRDHAKAPTGTGLGTQIVNAMASNLGSAVVFDGTRSGTSVTLTFPL